MSRRADNFQPLAKVKRGVTLSCSAGGDMYYLVTRKGSERIPLEKACKLYIAAKEKGDLLWNGSPTTPPQQPEAQATEGKSWRDELLEKLNYKSDPQ